MDRTALVFGVGIALMAASLLFLSSAAQNQWYPDMPSFLRKPVAIAFAGAGVFCIQHVVRVLCRERDIFSLVIMLGILGYIGYAALDSMFR